MKKKGIGSGIMCIGDPVDGRMQRKQRCADDRTGRRAR